MRAMTRWEPRTGMFVLNRGIDRMFDELFAGSAGRDGWTPAVNVLEKEDAIVITADLPGLGADDVEVKVEDGVLSLSGERALEEASEGQTYRRVERRFGSFSRTFRLPETVDPTEIEARFKNGEMVITVPKREEAKPIAVKIDVEQN